MKGKKGAQAQRRADQAALNHIDRLTHMLAEEKRRRLDAEAVARRFSHEENAVRLLQAQNDEALAKALDKLRWWQNVADQDHNRRMAAWRELAEHLRVDFRLQHITHVEWVEFLMKRYPRLLAALSAGDIRSSDGERPFRDRRSPYARMEARLSDDDVRRFQAVTGQRSTLKRDDGDTAVMDWALVFEASQIGFTGDEMIELMSDDH